MVKLDACGLSCPEPVMMISKAMKSGDKEYEITVDNDAILVKYESGMTDGYKLVTLDSNGQLISVRNQKNEQ